ncbi:sugar ABC transporter permease [Paenibacillus sp. PAMC21692]|uniref:ABC transporter permease n=1 Tax=Paenibacillus sp. PAMC21692 TaxID=2762320 RepID=UPI00164DE527|nr:sugar ABC transporter permease [Paenibacillus sp. PAMC21692]
MAVINKRNTNMTNGNLMQRIFRDFSINKYIYLMLLPVVSYYLLFYYVPMYGVQIAFKDFSPLQGITNSDWVGFKYFIEFFDSYYFWRVTRNTVLLSLYNLLLAFPAGIILALLLNLIQNQVFKRTVQSITYVPHFISLVVVVGMMVDFLSRDGLINQIMSFVFGIEPISFFLEPGWFRTLFISSGIWQNVGWNSIIFIAAIASIDPTLYEAGKMDGAGRWRQLLHITLPGIMPIITILFILEVGMLMAVSDEKILLMYKPSTYETADVIGTYVYRKGVLGADFGYSAAVGLFNSVINFVLLVIANQTSKKYTGNRLW